MLQALSFYCISVLPSQGESYLCHPCFSSLGLSGGKKRHDVELTTRLSSVRASSRQSSALGVVSALSRTQAWLLCFVALFTAVPKSKKYLLNTCRYTLRFEARVPNRKSSYYSSFLHGENSELFHTDIVKGISCGD